LAGCVFTGPCVLVRVGLAGPRTRVDAGDPIRLRPSPQASGGRLRWLQRNRKALALDVRIVMMEAVSCDAPKAPAG
jgi:hypothetical protein